MLVYYLKERTIIGRTGDIQFFGVGIQVPQIYSTHFVNKKEDKLLFIALTWKYISLRRLFCSKKYCQRFFPSPYCLLLHYKCKSLRVMAAIFFAVLQVNELISENSNKVQHNAKQYSLCLCQREHLVPSLHLKFLKVSPYGNFRMSIVLLKWKEMKAPCLPSRFQVLELV